MNTIIKITNFINNTKKLEFDSNFSEVNTFVHLAIFKFELFFLLPIDLIKFFVLYPMKIRNNIYIILFFIF